MKETHTNNPAPDKFASIKTAAQEPRLPCPYADHVLASSHILPALSSVIGFNPDNAEDYRWHIVDQTRGELTFYVLTFDVIGLFWKGLHESRIDLENSIRELCLSLISEESAAFTAFQLFQSDKHVKLYGHNGIRVAAVLATHDDAIAAEIPSIHSHLTDWADDWVGKAEKLDVRLKGIGSQEAKVLLGLMTSVANTPKLTLA